MKTHGVDFDKTLATYDEWRGADHTGEPIPLMVARVKKWLEDGDQVDIFTARVHPSNPEEDIELATVAVAEWFFSVFGVLPRKITCEKDPKWDDIWDDSTIQMVPNTGERADGVQDVDVDAIDGIGTFLK